MNAAWKAALCLGIAAQLFAADGQTDWQKYTIRQILELRIEVLEYLADGQKARLTALEHDLLEVRQRQKELDQEEQQRSEQLAQTEQQLATPELEARAKPQIEALRTQLLTDGGEKLRSERAAAVQKEAEISSQIERAAQRLRALHERARQAQTLIGQ